MDPSQFPASDEEHERPDHSANKGPKKPDFIYVDHTYQHERSQGSEGASQAFESLRTMQQRHYPLSLRFFTLGASFIFAIWAALMLICTGVSIVIAALVLFKSDYGNGRIKAYWKYFRQSLVFMLGLFVAAFSPAFGISIIILYYVQQGESIRNRLFARVFTPPDMQ